jgi:hypothetical protein
MIAFNKSTHRSIRILRDDDNDEDSFQHIKGIKRMIFSMLMTNDDKYYIVTCRGQITFKLEETG